MKKCIFMGPNYKGHIYKLISLFNKHLARREAGEKEEIVFWENWAKHKGGRWPKDYVYRVDEDSEVRGYHKESVCYFLKGDIRILDVGSGLLTKIGKKLEGYNLMITATDSLAIAYDEILLKYKINPPVRTIQCRGEDLLYKFATNSFDWANAENSLDHSEDPWRCIREMFACLKNRGLLTLYHYINEGTKSWFSGLHQWDFSPKGNDMQIKGKKYKVMLPEIIKDDGRVEIEIRNKAIFAKVYKT